MGRARENAMSGGATWKRIGLVFGAATLVASAALADEGDLQRGRRLRLPSRPYAGAVKELPNSGGDVVIIPDPHPKQRPPREGRREQPAAVEPSRQATWFAWFAERARH